MRTSLLVHAHARERLACVLRSSTLPLRSLARERLALIVALACNSPELTHRPSSSLMPMKHRALISMLMLENVLRSYRRTIVAHACNSPSLTVHHDGSRSQASCVLHAQARLAFVAAHRCSCAARLACGLRSSMLPCSRTPCFQRSSFNPAQPCAHRRYIVALACNSPHRPSSSLILSSIVRSSTIHPR